MTVAKLSCAGAVQVEKFDRDTLVAFAVSGFEATGELLPGIIRTPEW